MNPTRDKQIYISQRLSRRLYWLTRLEPPVIEIKDLTTNEIEFRHSKIITREDVAEKLLTEKIEQDFPNILALEKRVDALEKQLISELLNPTVK